MPQWEESPLIGQPYENVDEVQLSQWAATMVDVVPVVVEGKLQIVKRPGLQEFVSLGTNLGVDGLYWVDTHNLVLAVSQGRVWKITDQTGTMTELTGSTALRSSANVTFAKDSSRTVMANGNNMVYTDYSTLTTVADADAPTSVTHVAEMDGYVLANSTTSGRVYFSDIKDMTSWQALSFFEAESKPDNVLALGESFREIIALGSDSVEFWANDGQTPFARIPGSAQPFGISAPYSLANAGGVWIWLGHDRRLMAMQGRQAVPVSTPYDRIIQGFLAVSDAVGYTVSIDGLPIYLLNFPTAKQTIAFNYETKQWHKWSYWDAARGEYRRFRGLSYCYARAWNLHLVGDHDNGKIYIAKRGIYTDDGNTIRSLLRTGHNSYGVEATKQSDIFRLRVKRGQGGTAIAEPKISMRQRRDNRNWGQERWKSLGKVGEHEIHLDWRVNGVYKTCQREFVHSDNTDLVIMGANEYLTFLGA